MINEIFQVFVLVWAITATYMFYLQSKINKLFFKTIVQLQLATIHDLVGKIDKKIKKKRGRPKKK